MKIREYITATSRPVGALRMLSVSKIYVCELGPYWEIIKEDIVDSNREITLDVFKVYWKNMYADSEIEYPNIFWAYHHDYVTRNVHEDEVGEHYIKLMHGWAPVVSSLKLGNLACFMYPESQPSVAEECGLVYIYPWAEEYGRRI